MDTDDSYEIQTPKANIQNPFSTSPIGSFICCHLNEMLKSPLRSLCLRSLASTHVLPFCTSSSNFPPQLCPLHQILSMACFQTAHESKKSFFYPILGCKKKRWEKIAPKAPSIYYPALQGEGRCLLTLALDPYYDFLKMLFLLIFF